MSGVKGKSGVYIRTKQCLLNMSLSHQKPLALKHKQNVIKATIRKWQNPEYKKRVSRKISEALTGRTLSEAHRKKISETHWDSGGKNNPAWKGGISRELYGFDFNNELKELIRKRDKYKCQKCGIPQEECFKKLSVHHVDYNKKNNNPDNLIILCAKCHAKTFWENKKNGLSNAELQI